MKKVVAIALLIPLFMACRKNTESKAEYNLGVALHENFEADQVKLYIDNQTLFNGEVTTEHTLSLAKSISTTTTEGSHNIRVIVNGTIVASDTFDQNGHLYVGVSYNKEVKKVSFQYSTKPFEYD